MDDEATVVVADVAHLLDPERGFTFGRSASCDACLDPDDVGISRLAGSVDFAEGTWFVTNRSSGRPLSAADPLGFRTVLAPGRRLAVDGRLSVTVEGQVRRHEVVVVVPGTGPTPPPPEHTEAVAGEGLETEIGGGVNYTEDDRRALVALFAGYLRPFPRYDPRPLAYAEAAAVLGWPRTTLVKRIEYVRIRLLRAGVLNLQGEHAMEALAEHVLATGVIGRDDLALLG